MARLTRDVNKKDNSGWTPLQWAVNNDNTAAVTALASVSAVDWTFRSDQLVTALDWAR